MSKVLVLGGVSYDTIIHLKDFPKQQPATIHAKRTHETIGSTGAGKALSLNQLGVNVTLQGLIGDDAYGEKISRYLSEHHVNFLSESDPEGTERHVNLMNEAGNRISIFTNSSSFNPEVDYNKMINEIKHSQYIVLNIMNYCRNYIPLIKKEQKEIWCDIHDYDGKNPYHKDFIDASDYLFMSSDNLEDYKDVMKTLINQGKKLVICTHGKEGVTALTKDSTWYNLPVIEKYECVDTNGAGDNFFAGFLYGFIRKNSIQKCLQFGTITAGLCITSNELVSDRLTEDLLEVEYKKYYDN
ncbi:carbohydrate kinase family protein [Haloplasma contractile]|uniref:Ribokinase family sugar kinase protein n=1 Tax=Haloplasma contractile SSD-17B TaxID=1033810 RepID=U2FK14_9MOLU|nr:PfkB family carbohydrate kinase [Haloplasma contractile]ERJ13155.1 ribokinase family sugar kinase protein [Haloplasma contractile SSD-17B]